MHGVNVNVCNASRFASTFVCTDDVVMSARVQALEALINDRLKAELQRVLDRRDRVYERIAQCLELRNNMKMLITEALQSLKTKVNLGCDFYVDASMCAGGGTRAHSPTRRATDRPAPAQTRHAVGVCGRGAGLPCADDPRGGGDVW